MTKKRVFSMIAAMIVVLAVIPNLLSLADDLKKVKAYEFRVDDEKWFTLSLSDKAPVELMLDEYKKLYLENIDQNAHLKEVVFSQKIEFVEVEARPEELISLEEIKEKIHAVEEEEVKIKIKSGDNFWNLSKAYHLSVSELEILNPDVNPDKIFPGDILVVKPLNPVLDVIAELENTITEAIPFRVEYKKDNTMYKNQKKLIKEGVEGEKEVVYDITLLNGYQSSLKVKSEKILKQPINALVRIGTKTTVSRGGRVNYGVVSGKRISSLYGYRIHPITGKRLFHDGLDIAANHGNAVYAYTDGRVVQAGWNGGYGISILIDHGNGLKTRYAHLSRLNVRVGQRVQTGQKIGAVGSTGNSTGPHLHFEVIKNGKTQNPLNYI